MHTVTLGELCFVPMMEKEAIQKRVAELGKELTARYGDKKPLFVSVLSGAFVFAADLIREFDGVCEIAFVKLSSYAGISSTGNVKTILGLEGDLAGRDIIVVEDIVDSGRTLFMFLNMLKQKNPGTICTVSLLVKPDAIEMPVSVDYTGFEIENKFVVGYGLDYNGVGRNLPGIYVLKEE